MEVEYKIYNPCGNITALVIGDDYTKEQRQRINDEIMKQNETVEQVGFLSVTAKKLTMAGGEFCGNATRCATKYYLEDKKGELDIKVSGTSDILKSGKCKNGELWTQIPISKENIEKIENNAYKINLEGISHIVINKYVNEFERKIIIDKYIQTYNNESALGVVFIENIEKQIRINPYVWVKDINTLFYEQSCGSGSAAVGILQSFLKQKSLEILILQPYGEIIKVTTNYQNQIKEVRISGKIDCDEILRKLEVKE